MTSSDRDAVWRRPPDQTAEDTDDSGGSRPDTAAGGTAAGGTAWDGPHTRFRPAPASDESAFWTRPANAMGESSTGAAPSGTPPTRSPSGDQAPEFFPYAGPPPTNRPPPNWRPPVVDEPLPPSELPEQDHDRLDVEEQAARTLTQGIGMVAGAVMLVLLLILCARSLF